SPGTAAAVGFRPIKRLSTGARKRCATVRDVPKFCEGAAVLFRVLALWFLTHRRKFALVPIIATLLALVGLVKLDYDDVPRTLYRSHDADFVKLEKVFEQFGADDVDCV